MRPNTSGAVLLLGSLSLVQAAAHRRDGLLGRLRARGDELDKRQDQAQTVTVVQTVTVGGADGGIVANNTVTVTVTAACQPGAVNGAASSLDTAVGASATLPAVGAVASAPGAAVPGAQQQASGGIGVVIVEIPTSLRTPTRVGTPPPATSAAALPPAASVSAPVAQNPAVGGSSLAPLPGSSAAGSLQPLPSAGASSVAGGLQPLPSAGSSLAQLPSAGAGSSLAPLPSVGASSLAPLPSAGPASALQPLPPVASASNLAPLPSLAAPSAAPVAAPSAVPAAPAAPVDPNLIPPGGIADPAAGGATPVAGPDGSFGGTAGVVPIGGAGNPQAVVDPTVTQTPGVANAGAQVVNIDVSNLTLNSQLNLGNLVQATPAPAI
ncbi:hypothetical protein OQA88_4032 [Cercophora sp. LCS_1]